MIIWSPTNSLAKCLNLACMRTPPSEPRLQRLHVGGGTDQLEGVRWPHEVRAQRHLFRHWREHRRCVLFSSFLAFCARRVWRYFTRSTPWKSLLCNSPWKVRARRVMWLTSHTSVPWVRRKETGIRSKDAEDCGGPIGSGSSENRGVASDPALQQQECATDHWANCGSSPARPSRVRTLTARGRHGWQPQARSTEEEVHLQVQHDGGRAIRTWRALHVFLHAHSLRWDFRSRPRENTCKWWTRPKRKTQKTSWFTWREAGGSHPQATWNQEWAEELRQICPMVEFLVHRERKLDVKADVAIRRLERLEKPRSARSQPPGSPRRQDQGH